MQSKTELLSFIEGLKEKEFTIRIIMPLFEAMGYSGIRYNHSTLEKGKDLVFWKQDAFADKEYIAAQVKVGKFSGNVATKNSIRPLISQLQQVFDSPFTDLSGNEIFISKCFLIVSSAVTPNARESIKGLLRQNNLFRPVQILDGPEILSLLKKYIPTLLKNWKENISEYAKTLENKFKYYLDYEVMGLETQPNLEDFFIDVNLFFGEGTLYFNKYSDNLTYSAEISFAQLDDSVEDELDTKRSSIVVNQIENIAEKLRTNYKIDLKISIEEPKLDESKKRENKKIILTKILKINYKELAKHLSLVLDDYIGNNLNGARIDSNLNDVEFTQIIKIYKLLNIVYPILQFLDKVLTSTPIKHYEPILLGQSVDPTELFKRYSQVWMVGNAGTGKTTLLRYNTLTLSRQLDFESEKLKIPIFIPLNSYDFKNKKIEDSVKKILQSSKIQFHHLPIDRLFKEGNFILFLDGLDEISSLDKRQSLLQQIKYFSKKFPYNNIIISSRFLKTPPELEDYVKCHTMLFTEQQLFDFCKKWFNKDKRNKDRIVDLLAKNEAFRAIAKNPLYLTLIASLIQSGKPIPHRRVEIYSERLQLLLHKWDSSRGIFRNRFEPAIKLRILKKLAMYLHKNFKREFDYSLYERVVRDFVPTHFKNSEILRLIFEELISNNELIRQVDEINYDFGHLSFQEYFVALEIADTAGHSDLYKNILNPWWHQACLMFCGITRDASQIIEFLLYDTDSDLTDDFTLSYAIEIIIESDWTMEHYIRTISEALKYRFEVEKKTEYVCRLLSMMNSIAYEYFFDLLIQKPLILNDSAIRYHVNESAGEAFYSMLIKKMSMLELSCNQYFIKLMIDRNTFIEKEYLNKILKSTKDNNIIGIIKHSN